MALRIMVERVSTTPQNIDQSSTTYANINDRVPFEMVLEDDNTQGVNVLLLKAFLNLAKNGSLTTASSGTGATDSIRALIIAQHTAILG